MNELFITMYLAVLTLVTVQCFHISSDPFVPTAYSINDLPNKSQDENKKILKIKLQRLLYGLKEDESVKIPDEQFWFNRDVLRMKGADKMKTTSPQDAEQESPAETDEESLYDELIFHLVYKRFGKCIHFPLYSPKPIYMVNKCPHDSTDDQAVLLCHGHHKQFVEEQHKCVIDLQHIPVQDLHGVVYRNVYCSRCHGAHNVSSWTADLKFNDIPVLKLMDGFKNTSINILKSMDEMARCSKKIFPYNQNVIKHCKHPTSLRSHENRARNAPINPQPGSEKMPLSFQILINFGINGEGHIIFSTETTHPVETVSCPKNQVYYKGHCREVTCDEGYHLENNVCQPDPISLNSEDSLSRLQNANEMTSLTFRLNATKEELSILEQDGAEDMIIEEIAFVLNVSSSRIRDLTISIRNGTTQSQMIEIVHPRRFQKNRATENEDFSPEILTTKTEDVSKNVSSDNQQTTKEKSPDESLFTVEFKFDLLASIKKTGKFSSSLSSVVDNMNHLIRTQSFSLELNGSDFKITEIKQQQHNVSLHLIKWCNHGTKIMKKGSEVDMKNSTDSRTGRTVHGVFVNETGKFYGPDMFDFYIYVLGEFGNISNVTMNALVFLCDTPRIQNGECAKLTLNSTSYEKLYNNSVFYEGEVFDQDKYEYVDDMHDNIRICIYSQGVSSNILKTSCGIEFKNIIVAESYLSFVLGIISTVITFLSLITYVIFKEMRNLPGVSTANLTFALFLAELLFIVSGAPKPDWLCPVIGMMLHYLFLASFFWMNVMSYDLYKTFANKYILTRVRSKEKYLPRYALYAWGSPALIVAGCAVIDYTDIIPNVKIKYGGGSLSLSPNGFVDHDLSGTLDNNTLSRRMESTDENLGCWIQEPVAALVAFGSPMLLILFSNSVMFVKTIYCIRKTLKLANIKTRRSSLNHVTGKSDVSLYVRMSTMMGFTWISGLASSIVSAFADTPTFTICTVLHVMSFLFIIFNCSQGLFIFFAFICNRRVCKYYKTMLSGCKSKVSGKKVLKSSRISISTITSWTYTFEVVQITEKEKCQNEN
ncbi:uncharacterized protein LOC133205617 [Saccostrea echinata]|uniref:uncharacterized protein LOC133205617 n=1 Tax=Saccostrea echinata TaxID=191078 RepID=UPI002A801612|nr:uncharacterized protein LOC133205617 [Saccostrea echinata]